MTYTFPNKSFKKIKKGDPDFMMNDGIQLVPRAAIEFSELCPTRLLVQIQDAIGKGWIRPVSYMTDKEYVWEKLGE